MSCSSCGSWRSTWTASAGGGSTAGLRSPTAPCRSAIMPSASPPREARGRHFGPDSPPASRRAHRLRRVPPDPRRRPRLVPASCGACSASWRIATTGRSPGLSAATALEPGGYWYQFTLALRYQAAGQIDRALDHYNQAVAIDSDSPWARHDRAALFQMRGAWALALEDLQLAMKSTARIRSNARVPEPGGRVSGDGRRACGAGRFRSSHRLEGPSRVDPGGA